MKIRTVGIPVKDQEVAHQFYTEKLGFVTKHDIPLGQGHRWLTVVSPEEPDGPEILLEPAPNHFEPSKVYQEALFEAGIPCTQLNVDDIQKEYDRLTSLGVSFKAAPKNIGTSIIATLDDTCGNYVMLIQML